MINVNISGRVNPKTGHSYSRFNFEEEPLTDILSRKLKAYVCIENDTRAMALGEYLCNNNRDERDLLFINLSWGLGLGAVIDGKIVTGKSGFAGEFGHMVTCDNEVICHCGKKGCLETEASGSALVRKITERLQAGANSVIADRYEQNGKITLNDALEAVQREDLLAIEVVEEMGKTLGRWLAGLINVFNPEKVIIGGVLAVTGDYLLQPIRSAVRLYSLNLVNQDTKITLSRHGDDGGLIGACLIARNRIFDTLN
jgi:predicted NBD/HSP70 family sugar kinase